MIILLLSSSLELSAEIASNDLRLGDGGVSQRLEREQTMMLPARCQPKTRPACAKPLVARRHLPSFFILQNYNFSMLGQSVLCFMEINYFILKQSVCNVIQSFPVYSLVGYTESYCIINCLRRIQFFS